MTDEDIFRSRRVRFAFHGRRLEFDLARSVFASAGIDPGSSLLLRHLQSVSPPTSGRVLDLGCGVGTLGVTLQALEGDRSVVFVDRDALALQYTRANLVLNELVADPESAAVIGSLAYDELDRGEPFDLVVSNIPGKAGEPVISHIVNEAANRTKTGALVAVVIVAPLAALVADLFEDGPFELILRKGNKSHEVFIGRVTASAGSEQAEPEVEYGFAGGHYDRLSDTFSTSRVSWEATTVFGLDEFDNLGHPSALLRAALHGVRGAPSIVINPGQGHRAVIAALGGYRPETLVSRDLLSLKATSRMLVTNGFEAPAEHHTVEVGAELVSEHPVVILHAPDDVAAPWLYQLVAECLEVFDANRSSSYQLVLSGRSSMLGRLEADLMTRRRRGHVAYKKSKHGHRIVRYSVGV